MWCFSLAEKWFSLASSKPGGYLMTLARKTVMKPGFNTWAWWTATVLFLGCTTCHFLRILTLTRLFWTSNPQSILIFNTFQHHQVDIWAFQLPKDWDHRSVAPASHPESSKSELEIDSWWLPFKHFRKLRLFIVIYIYISHLHIKLIVAIPGVDWWIWQSDIYHPPRNIASFENKTITPNHQIRTPKGSTFHSSRSL